MGFDPQKFFIGIVDLFAVIMPGALLTFLVGPELPLALRPEWLPSLKAGPNNGAENWVAFLFVSYLLGHLVFLVGSLLLDNLVYDKLRGATEWGQIVRRLAENEPLAPDWLRKLATSRWVFRSKPDLSVIQVERIKARMLDPLSATTAINTFQWSKVVLQKDMPDGLASVLRFEADSKFFRSFVVVLVLLTVVYVLSGKPVLVLICLGFGMLALLRYVDQRFKSTQQAYWLIIMLESKRQERAADMPRTDRLTHAGGVVVRRDTSPPRVLMVSARQCADLWVLPKGHIEAGEAPAVTAVREVREETGCLASVTEMLTDTKIPVDGTPIRVRWYLMEWVEGGDKETGEERNCHWVTVQKAMLKAREENLHETANVLQLTEGKLGLQPG